MFNFLVLVLIVVLINKFLTRQANASPYSLKNPFAAAHSAEKSTSTNNSTMVTVISSEEEFKNAISASNLVVVDFFAVWCGPCKMIAPMLEKFSKEYASAKFYKVDVDQLPSVAASNEVTSMPTLLFFKSGELVGKVIGANPAAIKQTLDKLA